MIWRWLTLGTLASVALLGARGRTGLDMGAADANWLPTLGSQKYRLTFRYYGPQGGVSDGSYYPPPLEKLN